jgi:P-type Ca2+ transporter type 2C
VFNEINSRKLGVFDYNVFHGFFNNLLFLAIIIFTIGVQCLMVEYGGKAVRTSGLTYNQHIVCLAIGMFSLIQGLIVKFALPVKWFEKLQMKEEPMSEEEIKKAFTTTFRKSFRASSRMSMVRDAAAAAGGATQEGGATKIQ